MRPCPWAGCRYWLEPTHERLQLADGIGPTVTPDETCALDVADKGPHDLGEIGDLLGITRERVRQIEERAIKKLRASRAIVSVAEFADGWTHATDSPDGADLGEITVAFARDVDAAFRRVVLGETPEQARAPHRSPWGAGSK